MEKRMSAEIEILIVEKNLSQAEQLKHILEQHDHKVSVEHNAQRALTAMRQSKPQIVISAVLLPEMDGYALCREIKKDEKLKDIPVILLTSLSDAKDIIRGIECGADNFVTKPYDEKLLISRIEYIVLNRELRIAAGQQAGLEIIFNGVKYYITPERQQMVDLLISTYEAAVQRNLECLQVEKELKVLNERLKIEVKERTSELVGEVADRKHAEQALIESEEQAEQAYIESEARAGRALIESDERAEQALLESEGRLQQSQKMEAIGTLAGGVAHDFNNLLTVILGNTHLALRKLQPDDSLQIRLVEVEKAANRAAVLTRQLLAFSRRQHLERHTINLNDTINEIMKLLRRIIGEDIEVRVITTPGLSAIFADPAQIEQVIMNLAVNARDAMPEGGQLTIETSNVELDKGYQRQYPYVDPGKYVQIRISDTGSGIDAETQKHIFEPFFTTKEVDKGTGLGLSMAYGIVKQHEGHINVYSEVGHGTTFKIFLPVVDSAVETGGLEVQLPLLGGTETILVAEDEEALRSLAKHILEGLDYTVLLANNGEEAVEIYQANRERIDMLLLDVVMPRMSGVEAYKRIRELGGDVPLIFMTGYSVETVQNRFIKQNEFLEDLGAIVLHKPYNVEGLGRKVREVLDNSK
jgi:signal transduction histidine kinase